MMNYPKKFFIDIQENLNTMVEDHKEIYEDTDIEPNNIIKGKKLKTY